MFLFPFPRRETLYRLDIAQIPLPDGPNDGVIPEHRDPSNSSFPTTVQSGALNSNPNPQEAPAELDPKTASVGLTDPHPSTPPNGETFLPYPSFSSPSQMTTTYIIDGMRVPLDTFLQRFDMQHGGMFGALATAAKASGEGVVQNFDEGSFWEN
jgi:hypothetical protein